MIKDEESKEVDTTVEDNTVIDIEIKESPKKRFRINGDNSKILELNVSDMNVITRLSNGYEHLQKLIKDISDTPSDDENFVDALDKIDQAMRKELDYIFQSNVSEICGSGGNMYDPYGGMFRYEHILDTLTKLYANNVNEEFKKIKKRLDKHTGKYTKKK